MNHDTPIRPLESADAAAFQQLRLSALLESPSSFGSSYAEEKDRDDARIRSHLSGSDDRVFFGCFCGPELVGIVGVGREPGIKQRHCAFIRSLYVAPGARRLGVGRRLLEAGLRQAAAWPGVEQVALSVTSANLPAVDLYRSLGFVEVGRMPRALRIDAAYFDELAMVRAIDAS